METANTPSTGRIMFEAAHRIVVASLLYIVDCLIRTEAMLIPHSFHLKALHAYRHL
jgi:hypothetical protein